MTSPPGPAALRVRFEPSGRELELLAGERLLDAVDDRPGLRVLPTACRAGNCGACRVRVRTGAVQLEPAGSEELAALAALGCAADERLGCQVHARRLVLASGPQLVTLETVSS